MPKHEHHPFENQIFGHFREEAKKVHGAIRLLARQGFTVIDLEGHIITKHNIDEDVKPNVNYKRAPKLPQP